ncbi:MAG: hypothetical protein ACKVQJ_02835 [Pyrinomonadaceae bacterium]
MLARVLAATVAGGIAFFVLGFVIYGLLLDPMVMKPNMIVYPGLMKETPVWIPLVLANFVSAFLLAYIFDKWASISTFIGGVKGGAVVWFLIALSYQLMFMAFMNMSKNYTPVIADILGALLMGALGGGVIGAVLGLMNKDSASN